MNQNTQLAVIFDMDGVLIDSTKYIWESFNQMVQPFGVHFDVAAIKKYLGTSLRDAIALWKEDYGIDVGEPSEFSPKSHSIAMKLMEENAAPNPGVLQLLQDLRKNEVPLGIGTSSYAWRAEELLSMVGIRDYFDVLVTADDVSEHKPNPHVFLEAARQLGVAPAHCVVIEDAASGIQAAQNASMKSIGYLTEWNDANELRAADRTIRSFDELSYDVLARI